MYKVDLHTHSVGSPDGGVTAEEYERVLASGHLNVIAITDHSNIDFATRLHEKLGDKIIVGEEIMTNQGEIIGLYLKEAVPAGLEVDEAIKRIKQQDGLVYVPHPFETVRKGLHPATLESIAEQIDIIEVCNGRAFFQDRSQQAVVWARLNKVISAASSDAHGDKGLGKTYCLVSELPSRHTLLETLAKGTLHTEKPSLRALLYPKYHRLRKRVSRKRG